MRKTFDQEIDTWAQDEAEDREALRAQQRNRGRQRGRHGRKEASRDVDDED